LDLRPDVRAQRARTTASAHIFTRARERRTKFTKPFQIALACIRAFAYGASLQMYVNANSHRFPTPATIDAWSCALVEKSRTGDATALARRCVR
jgi:hypothetical protein